MPAFHSKYTGFIGVALLDSKNALALPWTTTKQSLNRESSIYQEALREIVALSRPILNFLNQMYPSELRESPAERGASERVTPSSLSKLARQPNRSFEPKLRDGGKPNVRVRYDADKKELDRIRKRLRSPRMGAARIGRLTLEYYLNAECPE